MDDIWTPDKSKLETNSSAAVITDEYDDLLYHDGPILFTGRNESKERIIGSSVERSGEIESYLHSVVDEATYNDFINRRISYPQVLRQAQKLFLLHWSGGETPAAYLITFDDIPEGYVPSEAAFCPVRDEQPTSEVKV
jgi:hypothetical protein